MSAYVVLIGHGSRSPDANGALTDLSTQLAAQLGVPVGTGFLEMAEPTIADALAAAKADGADRIVLLPFFLSPGMHVRRDLTRIVDDARRDLGIAIEIAPFLGSHPDIVRLLTETARQSLTT